MLLQKTFGGKADFGGAVIARLALDNVIPLVAGLLELRDEGTSTDSAVTPRNLGSPGAGLLREERVLHVDLADPRREDLHRLARLALPVENHVRGIEVDVKAGHVAQEAREVLGRLLAGFEDQLLQVLYVTMETGMQWLEN